ncbi:MAG: HEPN domain-containing protein [Treponema sp.]|jgi:HEPN domain-containing protein|nr:HEPN domain-containing protein [Treponema sp.]
MTLQDLLNQWFEIAADDLDVANGCLEKYHPPKLAIACYHFQQSAEKSLKGFLTYCDIEPPHIHNLDELCKICIEHDASFAKILELCNDLNPYSVITRYPKEKEITEHMAITASQQAQKIYDFCLAKVAD